MIRLKFALRRLLRVVARKLPVHLRLLFGIWDIPENKENPYKARGFKRGGKGKIGKNG